MNLAKQPVAMRATDLAIGVRTPIHLGINTGAFSTINDAGASGMYGPGNSVNAATEAGRSNESVAPHELEGEHSDIINLGGCKDA